MSAFLDELRKEVVGAHAAARAGARRRRRPRLARVRLRTAAGLAVACATAVLAVVLAGALAPDPTGPHVVKTVELGGIPVGATVLDGRLWVADARSRSLIGLDGVDGGVESRVPLRAQPEVVAANPRGGLWARVHAATGGASDMELLRVDPRTREILARVPVGPDGTMTVSDGAVWAVVRAHIDDIPPEGLYRVDAARGAVTRRIPLFGVERLAAQDEAVWALTSTGMLARLDAASGRIERRWEGIVPAAGATAGAVALAADPGGAWILAVPQAGRGTLVRIAGDRVLRRAAVPAGTLPLLAPAADGLWTAGRDADGRYRAARLDPRTGGTTAIVGLGRRRPVELVDAGARLWAVGGDGTLTAIAR